MTNVFTSPTNYDCGNEPAILYDNIFLRGTVTVSSEEAAYPYENALDGLTTDYWSPSAMPATFEVSLSGSEAVDCIGIVGELNGAVVIVEYYESSAWSAAATFTGVTATCWVGLFASLSKARWRVRFTGSTAPILAILYLGKAMRFERRIYVGHSPAPLSRITDKVMHMNEGGMTLGSAVVRRGVSTSVSVKNADPTWYRQTFDRFVQAAIDTPYFFAWRPMKYREAMFGETQDDIRPTNALANGFMETEFQIRGIAR